MHTPFVRTARLWAPALLLSVLAACGPSDLVGKDKIGQIEVGMRRDAVLSVLGRGVLNPNQPSDSLRLIQGFRQQQFLSGGNNYQILWYREKPGTVEEQITRENETPVLFQGDTVIAAGWSDFDDAAAKLNLPNPYRAKERLDSLIKGSSGN